MTESSAVLNTPLTSFAQEITSSDAGIRPKAGQPFVLNVTVRNPGEQTWANSGQAPVNLSYKWFLDGQMLPIEGERTVLPQPVAPGESLPVQMKVVAPGKSGKLLLHVSLVQEGVAWFMFKGGKPLELAVEVD